MDFFLSLLCFNLNDLYIFKLLNKIDILLVLFCFSVLCMRGVNEFKEKISAVSNNRHFIVIHNDATTTKPDDHILWMFGAENIHNPHGYEWIISKIDSHVRFKDKQSRWHTIWNYSSYGCGEKPRPDKFARSASSSCTIPAANISLMERENVNLHTDVAELQEGDLIKWWTKSQEIAEVTKQSVTIHDNKIKDRIELDNQTGSLTIKNIRTTDSGDYECFIKKGNTGLYKCFTVTVYGDLPIPDIRRVSSASSSERSLSSKCVLLCSVLNVRDVSLSWYKGNSLLSSINESDLIRLSLPLEVEYQDTNTYRCVVNNPITNQTQHLNITHLCQPFPGSEETSHTHSNLIGIAVVLVVVMSLAAAAAAAIAFCKRKHNQDNGRLNRDETSAPLADSNEV
ncbi:uncharacterized protein [Paramisgurnus dabryanus]|uniref:uncharacterized protein n=1 Tax=Paramisgurnus dabryanus TaxID=90735 RepID=UPI0031F468D4